MDRVEWADHDRYLLTKLWKARQGGLRDLGVIFDDAFYEAFDNYVSTRRNVPITKNDIARRVRHYRSLYSRYKVTLNLL